MPSMMVATLGIALPEIRQTFSLSEVAAGSLFSVMMMIAAVTSSIAGRLADKIGRKTVLISGLTLLALSFGLAGVSGHPILFFLLRSVTGIGYGFTPPSLYAIMSDLLPNRRGLGTSLVSVAYGIGGAIGAVLASRVMGAFGWRAAFVTVAVIATANVLVQLFLIRNAHRIRVAAHSGSFKDALSLPILILALAEFVGGSVFWSSAAWTPTALRTAKALTLQQTGWVMGVLSLANMVGSFFLGSLSDKLGRRIVIALSAFPAAAAAFVVFLVGISRWSRLGNFRFRFPKSLSARSGGRAGARDRARRRRRHCRRHHYVVALYLGRSGAADCRKDDYRYRRYSIGDDFGDRRPSHPLRDSHPNIISPRSARRTRKIRKLIFSIP
jgi:MFS family permease